jgi:transposase-like protein
VLAEEIRHVFDSPDLPRAQDQLTRLSKQYEKSHPAYSSWLSKNIPEGLSVFAFEETHRKKLRTSDIMENTNRQLKTRTRLIGLFPNESSLLRLASALLNELSDDWECDTKSYMNFPKQALDSPS